jgi:hypothetical protein
VAAMRDKNLLLTETKMENMIDRIRGSSRTSTQYRAGAG